jgi:hypothetical protein
MFARALVVLLLMLNLGVALWWVARPAPSQHRPAALPTGVERLQLVGEVPVRASLATQTPEPGPLATDTALVPAPATTDTLRCFRFGPFADAQAAARARDGLSALPVAHTSLREVVSGARGWSVSLPPLADRAAASLP